MREKKRNSAFAHYIKAELDVQRAVITRSNVYSALEGEKKPTILAGSGARNSQKVLTRAVSMSLLSMRRSCDNYITPSYPQGKDVASCLSVAFSYMYVCMYEDSNNVNIWSFYFSHCQSECICLDQ